MRFCTVKLPVHIVYMKWYLIGSDVSQQMVEWFSALTDFVT